MTALTRPLTLADRDALLALLEDLIVGDRTTAAEAVLLDRWRAEMGQTPETAHRYTTVDCPLTVRLVLGVGR